MSTAEATTRRVDGSFVRTRLGSLLAVVPLAVWTVNHLWNNLSAFQGAAQWQADVTEYRHPIVFFASGLIALLPLVLHTIWGIGRLLSAQPNTKYAVQRLSAIGVMFFLGAHIWLAFLDPRINTGRPEAFAHIAHEMRHHLPTLVVYLLGTLGVAYHLANGLHSFSMGWGLVVSRRALKRLDVGVIVIFLVLLGMSWGAIYALWSAGGSAGGAAV